MCKVDSSVNEYVLLSWGLSVRPAMTGDNHMSSNAKRMDAAVSANAPLSNRTVTRIVGTLYLAAMLVYGPGNAIIASLVDTPDFLSTISANRYQFIWGATLMLMNSVIVIFHGVLLFPVLRQHSKRVAIGYVCTRVVESTLLAAGVVSLLLLVGIGEQYQSAGAAADQHLEALGSMAVAANGLAYQIAMAGLGVGCLFFCGLLYQTGLVPRWMAAWGFVGYATLAAGAVLELFGFGVSLLLSAPGGLFEVTFGVWLIVRGFNDVPVR